MKKLLSILIKLAPIENISGMADNNDKQLINNYINGCGYLREDLIKPIKYWTI